MKQGVTEAPLVKKDAGTTSTPTKYTYFFGGGKAEGNGSMKDVLGGKGAGLAEMTNAGLPVPPGFTIQTEACREYMRGKLNPQINVEMLAALKRLEKLQGQELGAPENPLLVSVRSGAKFSMPGMMDTILNLGLNDRSVEGLARGSNDPRFAYDSYRRLIQMFGYVVLDINKKKFEHIFDSAKASERVKLDYLLSAKALKEVIVEYKKLIKKESGKDFPQNPLEQLVQPATPSSAVGTASAPRPIAASIASTTGWAPPSTCSAWSSATWATPPAPASASPATRPPASTPSSAST